MVEELEFPMGEVESFAGKFMMVFLSIAVIIIALLMLYPIYYS